MLVVLVAGLLCTVLPAVRVPPIVTCLCGPHRPLFGLHSKTGL